MSLDRPSMQQDDHPDHNMPEPEHDGVQLAGDVLSVPTLQGGGMDSKAVDYALGNKTDPKVLPIGDKTLRNWMVRTKGR